MDEVQGLINNTKWLVQIYLNERQIHATSVDTSMQQNHIWELCHKANLSTHGKYQKHFLERKIKGLLEPAHSCNG